MKKLIVVLGLLIAVLFAMMVTAFMTQDEHNDETAKIDVVKNLVEYELQHGVNYDDYGLWWYLSEDFNSVRMQLVDFEHGISEGIGCVDTAGFVVAHQDTLDLPVIRQTLTYQVVSNGNVQAEWAEDFSGKRQPRRVDFKVINEGNRWVVDDMTQDGYIWKKAMRECMAQGGLGQM